MLSKRVLVVGTTPDYIQSLSQRFPGRLAFVTDIRQRRQSDYLKPPKFELVDDLMRPETTIKKLSHCLDQWNVELSGLACFDCESLLAAAKIGESFSLRFVSPDAVRLSRNKYHSKKSWKIAGISCPECELVGSVEEALQFMDTIQRPVILKPQTGSGSELLFSCSNLDDCRINFLLIKDKLTRHTNVRMYGANGDETGPSDTRLRIVVEELIRGKEFSSDFIIDNGNLRIIRIAEKIPAESSTIGTTLAYQLPATLPAKVEVDRLKGIFLQAAQALGITRSIVMVDFIVSGEKIFLLEMTPRPGGDCLPWLIEAAGGFDILKAAIDFSEGSSVKLPRYWRKLVGLRLFADRPGIIEHLDLAGIDADPRVRQTYLKVEPGHEVILPPDDYDSRVLGHVIFKPTDPNNIQDECLEIHDLLKVNYRSELWKAPMIS